MQNLPTPLVLSRKPRRPGDPAWDDAPSWFGGGPALGGNAWPRSSGGRPLTFLAQVSLAEIAKTAGPSVLPVRGSLAFFIGGDPGDAGGATVHVEQPGVPTEPPPDAPAAYERMGEIFPAKAHASAPRIFPRWPLDVTPVPELGRAQSEDDEDDEWGERRAAAIDGRFRRRQYFLAAKNAWERLGVATPPVWWHSAQVLADYLAAAERNLPARIEQHRGFAAAARAQVEKLKPPAPRFGFGRRQAEPTPQLKNAEDHLRRNEAKVLELENQSAAFSGFVAEVAAWAVGKDSWSPMAAEDIARLKAAYAQTRDRGEFGDIARYRVPSRLDDIETETLLAMMTGDERAFAALPAAMRALINQHYLLPTQGWHQMFGAGVDIQGNAAVENEGNFMLLQLVYDDMIAWRFGDMGAFQFWIPRADLAAGRWKAVRVTFEMG